MRRDEAYLLDMLIAARDVISFAGGLTRDQFEASRLLQLAFIKLIETIGEAAARVRKKHGRLIQKFPSPSEEPARHWRYDRETCLFKTNGQASTGLPVSMIPGRAPLVEPRHSAYRSRLAQARLPHGTRG